MTDREERFRALFDACYQPLQAFARRRAAGADADDLVAEVFTVAWRRLDDIPDASALAWLYGVAHRCLANQRRSAERRGRLLRRVASHAPPPTPVDDVDHPVMDAIATLRTDDQDILRLAAWEGLSTGEIATVLGCSANAAALRLSPARARLREAMTPTNGSRTQVVNEVTDG